MRLFVAVDLDEKIRDSIYKVAERLSKLSGLKLVEKENLHITLMFLGEVSEAKVDLIKEKLSEIKFDPFEISFKGIGFFPPKGNPRVVWIGIENGEDKLKYLANEVSEKLKKLGFKRDKEFSAHVTIARVKRRVSGLKELLSEFENEVFGSMVVDKFKLKRSILKHTGPIYTDIEVFDFK